MTHPEDLCQRCGGPNVVWFVNNRLWKRVMPKGGIVCPTCFIKAAEAIGFQPPAWHVVASALSRGAAR